MAADLIGWIRVAGVWLAILISVAGCGTAPATTPPVITDTGGALTLDVRTVAGAVLTDDQLNTVGQVIGRRLSSLGAAGQVDLGDAPGTLQMRWLGPVSEAEAVQLATVPGSVQFYAIPLGEATPQKGDPAPGGPPLFGWAEIDSATVAVGQQGTEELNLRLVPAAAQRLAGFTDGNVGGTIPVAQDGIILLAPTVNAPILDGHLLLSGPDLTDVRRLAALLTSGPLPDGVVVTVKPNR